MPLDPRAEVFLQMLHRIDAPRLHQLPIEVARRNFQKMLFLYREPLRENVRVQDCTIPRRAHEGGDLTARLYSPAGTGVFPVLLWLHGGGWTLGDLSSYDPLCRALADEAGVAVFALDYRLAPEHRFPAAVDDAWQALRWLRREGAAFGLDVRCIAVGGDSTGGNLAAVLALMARDAGFALAQQLLVYPAVDLAQPLEAIESPYREGHFLDLDGLRWFQFNYLEAEADRLDWRASPIRAVSHAGVAPAVVVTAECDLLTPDAKRYAKVLADAGVPTRYHEYAGAIHGFLTFPKLFASAGDALVQISHALRQDFGLENAQ